jgi:hypothetical protein
MINYCNSKPWRKRLKDNSAAPKNIWAQYVQVDKEKTDRFDPKTTAFLAVIILIIVGYFWYLDFSLKRIGNNLEKQPVFSSESTKIPDIDWKK